MDHTADGMNAPASPPQRAKTPRWPVCGGALLLLLAVLSSASPALGGDPLDADQSFNCPGDGRNSVVVRSLESGPVLLQVGAQAQIVSASSYVATVGALEEAIADWHGGGYIPRRRRSLVTGEVLTRPSCDGVGAGQSCEPITDASDSVRSRYGGGFLHAKINLVGDCVDGTCRRADVRWGRIETIEAAAACLAQAIPGWQPRPRPNGDGRVRRSSPTKPQK